MKVFRWSHQKNEQLKRGRHVSFEEIVVSIASGGLLDILQHTNPRKYPNQRIFVVRIGDYVYLVPFIETSEQVFLKTIIPSRRATKNYLRGDSTDG